MNYKAFLLAALLAAGCAGSTDSTAFLQPSSPAREASGAYSRARQLTLDPTFLPEQGGTVQAPLFEGLSLTLDLAAPTRHADGSQTWTGFVVGDPSSTVTFARYREVVCGTVVCAQGAFELAWQGDGQLLVSQRDPRTRGQCGDSHANEHQAGGIVPKTGEVRASANSTVDLYCVYNQAVVAKLGSEDAVKARIAEQVAESNQVFTNSNVEVRLNLLGSELVSYTQADTTP